MKTTRRVAMGVLIVGALGLAEWSRIQHGGRIYEDLRDVLVLIIAVLACYGAEKLFEGTVAWTIVGWALAVLVSIGLGGLVAMLLGLTGTWAWIVLGIVALAVLGAIASEASKSP